MSRRRIFVAALLVLALLLSAMPPGLAAEDGGCKLIFEYTESAGRFDLTVSIADTTFIAFQFALRYDPAVLRPVDGAGNAAEDFRSFAKMQTDLLSTVGTELDAERGLIDFAAYVPPGSRGEGISRSDDYGTQATVGADGMKVVTFRFERLKAGDAGLGIATSEKGEPFNPACEQGAIVNGDGVSREVTALFREAKKPQPAKVETIPVYTAPVGGQTAKPQKTVASLMKGAILLKIGSHAAVVEDGVTALYPGEKEVRPYLKNDRTFVPIRFVSERLGAEVDWDNPTQTAIVEKDGRRIEMPIGSDTFTVDGEQRALDARAELVHDRTMVPIRFISEALGYGVEWDQQREIVIILPANSEWVVGGEAEEEALDSAVRQLAMYGSFV